MKIFVLFLLSVSLSFRLVGQDGESDILIDLGESISENEENKINLEELEEELSEIPLNKIDLNKATITDLLRIPNLSETEAKSILTHRKKFGFFFSLYELKYVPLLDLEKIKSILPYIYIPDSDERKITQRLKPMKNEIQLRYDRTLETKEGYKEADPDSKKSKYIGDPNHYYLKYKLQCANLIQAGFAGEKDAGEAIWDHDNKVFDFTSAHLQINDISIFKRICVGDYKANFGQGLVIGTSSIIGKSNNVLNSMTRNRGIIKYSSVGESGFMRGGGFTIQLSNWETTLFASHKKIDTNISEDSVITSFKSDGLHRTDNEIKKERNTTETIFGGNLTYKQPTYHIGATFLHYRYGDSLQPADVAYNQFKLQQTDRHWNAGIDYEFRKYKMNFFGEMATDNSRRWALLNGCKITPSSRIGILLLYRNYAREYQANFANGFGESKIENEEGLYLGCEMKPIKRVILSFYADVFRFPWLKFNVDKCYSSGHDYLVYTSFLLAKETNLYLKLKGKNVEKNDIEGTISDNIRRSLRCGLKNKSLFNMETHTLFEVNFHDAKGVQETYGWAAAQDISFKIRKPQLKLSFRYAYFHAPDYDNRIYIYEKDILYVFSIPAYYGIGHRLCLNAQYNLCNTISLYLKYAISIYADGRESISSGLEEIKGNHTSVVKALVRMSF
ncbi:MAG TPA: helix-hairpin-helix domain-containing protein [Paludibacteraceae bacterium]|nr:helix-hairpin-helix domain-containing protein [Paludibacteraceae bacterium]HOU67016.1 helix-hairpin-helix domain-containing protein [Paludibacteraceae bacterium]HPH62070.1 helix-hairpin-helix domain-containing protein [Paludibacteraceae bacterium]HQF49219.1 helix-hairpin-helix domain-containing protein [Paludibacteraceae bacterium]